MNEPIPKLEPLSDSLKQLDIGEFLKSREFKRYRIQAGLDEYWRELYNNVKRNRRVFSVGMDHEKYDSIGTLNLLMNHLCQNNVQTFYLMLKDFIYTFSVWNKEPIDFSEIIEDLELLDCPDHILNFIASLGINDKTAVPKSTVSSDIWNAKKLEECINKMDISIKHGEFNLTLTYAYSCLEGIFKAYIKNNVPENIEEDKITKMARIVKTHLKEHFEKNDEKFPEPMLELIGTITNAVSNARNNFSESHFDKTSDKWLAEFARDCVNSVSRLVLKFV